jgi:kumamolisin
MECRVKGPAGPLVVCLCLAALAMNAWAPAVGAAGATPGGAAMDASLRQGASAALAASRWAVLAHSSDLGASTASRAGVIARLRTTAPPVALEHWAAAVGLQVTWETGDDWAALTGRASSLGRSLHVKIDEFRAPDGGRFYAATRPARPPTPDVVSMGSIDSYGHFEPLDVPTGGIPPLGLRQAYDATPLTSLGIEGQGETIVFFEVDGFKQSDLDSFTSAHSLPPINVTVVGGQAGPPGGEAELDLEAAHAVAPAAQLVYFNFSADTASGMATDFTQVSSKFPGALWSFSLGGCESLWGFNATDFTTLEGALEKADAGGSTVFASSGDAGGLDCTPTADFGDAPQSSFAGVNLPADFPAVVGVGGTRLSVTTSGAYAGEQAWTEPLLSQGSGGGVSVVFDPPSYQSAPGTGDYGSAEPGRQVPDVAAIADPATGMAAYTEGSPSEVGGTSLSAPVWAGFMALIDQYLTGQHLPAVSVANVDLYKMAAQPQPYPPFHEIAEGGSAVYPATPGYNMVTGLGSPDVWNVARDLAQLEASQ